MQKEKIDRMNEPTTETESERDFFQPLMVVGSKHHTHACNRKHPETHTHTRTQKLSFGQSGTSERTTESNARK